MNKRRLACSIHALVLLIAPMTVEAQLPKTVRAFKTPGIAAVQGAYTASVLAARKAYSQSLDTALKAAMASGNLTEANAINSTKTAVDVGGDPPTVEFKTSFATQAKAAYDGAIARARTQYVGVLQGAQRQALAGGDLQEANAIQGEIDDVSGTVAQAKPAIGGTALENADLIVSGTGYTVARLENNTGAWSNRSYKWVNVPAELNGALYTKVNGGESAEITVKAKRDTVVRVMIDTRDPKGRLTGWSKTKTQFTTSGNNTDMCVFEKKLAAGKELKVPQVSWCGTLVLVPAG